MFNLFKIANYTAKKNLLRNRMRSNHHRLLLLMLGLQFAKARLFDSILSYRHGTSAINTDTATYQTYLEPRAPESVDDLFGYTRTAEDGTISVVHCYSMRNGLYGSPNEARIIWSKVDPSAEAFQDISRTGKAEHERVISLKIESQIRQFAVHETDLSAFMIIQSAKRLILTLYIVPGPDAMDYMPVRTFEIHGLKSIEFNVANLLLLPPQAKKAIIYGPDYVGEIDLTNYPYTDKASQGPDVKIYRFQRQRVPDAKVGVNSDTSTKSQLIQIQPVYVGEQQTIWANQLFMLSSNLADFQTTLRIDIISALDPLGSAVNIARINTEAVAAYKAAKFAQIAQDVTAQGNKRFVFATASYQNYPVEAIYLTISEATISSDSWINDSSQAFVLPVDMLAQGGFVEPLAVRPKAGQKGETKFTVYLSSPLHLFRAEMAVQQDSRSGNWSIMKAELFRSHKLKMDIAANKVFFQPNHLTLVNKHWPDFYMVMTRTQVEQLNDNKERVRDGMIYSEYVFRHTETLKLMSEKFDIKDQFEQANKRGALSGLAYTDSTIMMEDDEVSEVWNRTLILDNKMIATEEIPTLVQRPIYYGTEWTDNVDVCRSEIDYKKVVTTGIRPDQIVSYMDVQESSPQSIFDNQIALAEAGITDALTIYNDIDHLFAEIYYGTCEKDATCTGNFALCFYEQTTIVECDNENNATNRVWTPKPEQIVNDPKLVGQTWRWNSTITEEMPCYFATLKVETLDGRSALIHNPLLTKRIFVADTGKPPYLVNKKIGKQLYAQAGKHTELRFSIVRDPEGNYVRINFKLGEASKFTYWDPETLTLIIEEGKTKPRRDEGDYPIRALLIEIINGIRMPAVEMDFNLTIGFFPPVPATYNLPKPLNQPRVNIPTFLMNGRMKITFSHALDFPNEVMLRDNMQLDIIPGDTTDPSLLGFSYSIEQQSDSHMDIKFDFEYPMELSQNQWTPERLNLTIYMGVFTDPEGKKIDGYANVVRYVPRQIPSQAEAEAIEFSGNISEASAATIGITNFIVSLILATSLNQLWSMLNGLQLAVHLPLLKTAFPANANFLIRFIIDVATFDLLPSVVLPAMFDFPVKSSFNQQFQDTKYENMYPVMNLGTCFFLFNIYLLQLVIYAILSCFKDNYKLAAKWYNKYDKMLFWGGLIRLFFEGYLELCLSVFSGLTDMEWSGENNNSSVFYSNLFTSVLTILLITLPIFIVALYNYYVNKLDDQQFTRKWGHIFEGLYLNKDYEKRRAAIFYPFWFCMRRMVFALVCILAQDDLLLQISATFAFAFVNLCYLVIYKPFKLDRITNLEIMNELCYFILLYHVITFSGMVPEAEDRYLLGWSFIFFLAVNMLVHVILLIIETYGEIRVCCKRNYKCCRKQKKKDERDDSTRSKKNNLSIIEEEEEDESLESNFSEKPYGEKIRARKVSESDWDSYMMGGSEGGFDIGNIKWGDLGRKFMIKRGKKSRFPEIDIRSELDSARRSRTLDPAIYSRFRGPQEFIVSPRDRQEQAALEPKYNVPQLKIVEEKENSDIKKKPKRKRHSVAIIKQQIYEDSSLAPSALYDEDPFATVNVNAEIVYQGHDAANEVRRDMIAMNVNNFESERSLVQEHPDTHRAMIKINGCVKKLNLDTIEHYKQNL